MSAKKLLIAGIVATATLFAFNSNTATAGGPHVRVVGRVGGYWGGPYYYPYYTYPTVYVPPAPVVEAPIVTTPVVTTPAYPCGYWSNGVWIGAPRVGIRIGR
jgi:hypothetical protein